MTRNLLLAITFLCQCNSPSAQKYCTFNTDGSGKSTGIKIKMFHPSTGQILGLLIFGMLLAEIAYIIHVYRFRKKAGIVWEKPKPDTDKPKAS